MKRFILAILFVAILAPLAEARPFRRTKAVARTGPFGGVKAKAKTGRIRRISAETTAEQAVEASKPGQRRWLDWDSQSRRDVPGQGRQNDDLR